MQSIYNFWIIQKILSNKRYLGITIDSLIFDMIDSCELTSTMLLKKHEKLQKVIEKSRLKVLASCR